MRFGARGFAVLASAAMLSACGGQQKQEASAAETPDASPTKTPPVAFTQCRSCHTVEAGRTLIGPCLHGIVGKPAASVAGFAYSNALKASRLTWNEKTLDAWLASPARLVPGNMMMFAGQPDAARRKEIIDYLAAQK